jgi:hypothetical protein
VGADKKSIGNARTTHRPLSMAAATAAGYLAQENPLLGAEGKQVPAPEPPKKLAQLMSFRVWADPQQGQGGFSFLSLKTNCSKV